MTAICLFELDKPNATYFSGETIIGSIILKTTNIENVRNICIIFSGKGKVKWTESVTYKSKEVYIKDCNFVHEKKILPAGEHKWNFKIPLPLQCPTSLEGKYGYVRYKIALKIHRPKHSDKIYKKPVTVIKTIDLNLDPLFKQPLFCEKLKTIRYLTLSKDEIIFSLFIPLSAYAPGQCLKYSLNIQNKSRTNVEGYCIAFTRTMTFTANNPKYNRCYYKDTLLYENLMENCSCHTNRIIAGEIIIPSTPPSSDTDDLICVQYKLKITLNLSGFSRNPKLSVPIIIGTIPIRESSTSHWPTANDSRQTVEPTFEELGAIVFSVCSSRSFFEPDSEDEEIDDQHVNADFPPSYSEIEPPGFEEATGIN